MRAALAPGLGRGAAALAIKIVADVDHQGGLRPHNGLAELRKGPSRWVVAVLEFACVFPVVGTPQKRVYAFETTTRVAECNDGIGRSFREWKV